MSRKSKQSKAASHKAQKSQAKNRAAMKARLQNRQNRRESFYDFLDEAYGLFEDGHYAEVRALLLVKFAQNPRAESDESLELLGEAAIHLKDCPTIAKVYRKLAARSPDEVHFQVNYAAATLSLALPVIAKNAFEKLQKNWPDDPLTSSAGETVKNIERSIESLYGSFPWSDEERPALALLHEEMMYGIAINDFTHVIRYGEQLRAQRPDFPAVYNNLALAYRELGRATEAIQTCETLLARDPENPHTILILGDCLYALGRRSEARAAWSRLKTLPAEKFNRGDWLTRKIEAHIRLGEYAEALAAFESGVDQKLFHSKDPQTAIDYHLGAVAAARLGQHRTASQYWTRALEINPTFDLAEDNREDHEQPEGERTGAWFERSITWIPRDLANSLRGKKPGTSAEREAVEMLNKLAERLPELPDLITDALMTGSPRSRSLAIALCKGKISALHERLREFALSTCGTDADRTTALFWLREQEIIRDKYATVWIKGKPTELKLLNAKITFKGSNNFPPAVEKIQEKGYYALQDHRFAEGEKWYRQAIELHGDDPSLLFNLAKALHFQHKDTEAAQIFNEVIERWPDYFFGRVEQANRSIKTGDYQRARELLMPLGELDEYHISEFNYLSLTWADLEIRAGNLESARTWIDQIRHLDPDNPNLPMLEQRLSPRGGLSFLKKWFS